MAGCWLDGPAKYAYARFCCVLCGALAAVDRRSCLTAGAHVWEVIGEFNELGWAC